MNLRIVNELELRYIQRLYREGFTNSREDYLNWLLADALNEIPEHRIIAIGWDHEWYRRDIKQYSLNRHPDGEGRTTETWKPENRSGDHQKLVDFIYKIWPEAVISIIYTEDGPSVSLKSERATSSAPYVQADGPKGTSATKLLFFLMVEAFIQELEADPNSQIPWHECLINHAEAAGAQLESARTGHMTSSMAHLILKGNDYGR